MKLWKYIVAAFNARPLGIPVPPNWIGLTIFGLLSFINPGFAIVGVGLELFYLFGMVNSKKFQMIVDGVDAQKLSEEAKTKILQQVRRLPYDYQSRYQSLVDRCETIMRQQRDETPKEELIQQAGGLSRLVGFYLQLLLSKKNIESLPESDASIPKQIKALEKKIANTASVELQRSYSGQLQILKDRMQIHSDTDDQLAYVDAELERIEQQVELLREQTVAATSPSLVSERIDNVAATLSGTNNYMRQHREIFGQMEDTLSSPPPIIQAEQFVD